MTQSSGPISQGGSAADRQFSDVLWRDIFGDEAGVIGDQDGSAYSLTLVAPDIARIGSTTQQSTSVVAGFGHKIPINEPEDFTIPVATGTARTDIIANYYHPTHAYPLGPVRTVRVAGTSAALPILDDAPGGGEYLPLWAITRQPGQDLSNAVTQKLYTRLSRVMHLPPGARHPSNSPYGSLLLQGAARYIRRNDSSNNLAWVADPGLAASGRVPISILGKVPNGSALMNAVAIPPVDAPTWVTFTAMGQAGFDDTAVDVGWDWDSISNTATGVTKDLVTRITAPGAKWATMVTTLSMTMPAGGTATARLRLSSSGPAYNRGSVIWHRSAVLG